MPNQNQIEKKQPKKDLDINKTKLALVISGVILFLVCVLIIGYYFWDKKYHNKIYPNIEIGDNQVAGQTFIEVLDQLDNGRQDFDDTGLVFEYQNEKLMVPTTYIKDEVSGVSVDILMIDTKATTEQAYQIGRSGDFKKDFFEKLSLCFKSQSIDPVYTLNQTELELLLEDKFSEYENPALDAQLDFDDYGNIIINQETEGQAFMWPEVIQEVRNNINNWENKSIVLTLQDDYPEVKKQDTDSLVQEVENLLNLAPLTLIYEDRSWEIEKQSLQKWLMFSSDGVVINQSKTITDLDKIALEIDQAVKEGKFDIIRNEDSTISIEQFQDGANGLELKKKKTVQQIIETWINNKNNEIELMVEVTEPKATPGNVGDLGIKELLGTGHTNFSGSPYNRIQNITKGANILHGLLIAPGETFALIETLGHIDGANGWLPELVIKDNKTIPEFGGGLCQIGSTSFRTALNSGLEIVERRNHSYVVSYYNYNGLAGVDATIYEPKPDFRFKNDTNDYILWQVRIEGADLYFDFWGTSDGRKGYFTDPINYNYVSPPETVITEVDNLEPGQLNCTEKAHTGVTAEFDYIIDYPNGEQYKETFTSVYKALPAVCEKGKEKEENKTEEVVPPANTETNTNTNTNKNKNTNKNNINTNKKQS